MKTAPRFPREEDESIHNDPAVCNSHPRFRLGLLSTAQSRLAKPTGDQRLREWANLKPTLDPNSTTTSWTVLAAIAVCQRSNQLNLIFNQWQCQLPQLFFGNVNALARASLPYSQQTVPGNAIICQTCGQVARRLHIGQLHFAKVLLK